MNSFDKRVLDKAAKQFGYIDFADFRTYKKSDAFKIRSAVALSAEMKEKEVRQEMLKKIEERITLLKSESKEHEFYSTKNDEQEYCNCEECEKRAKAILELQELCSYLQDGEKK